MRNIISIFFCALTVFIFSCRTIKPEAPTGGLNKVPAVTPISSQIIFPIRADLSTYFKMAENLIPSETKGEDNPCEGLRYAYVFQRGPLTFSGFNNQVKLSLNGQYQVSGSYCAKCAFGKCLLKTPTFSCGVNEPMRNIVIGFSSNVAVTPKYGLQTQTALDFVQPNDPCKISFLQVDVTDKLVTQIKTSLQQLAAQTDIQTAAFPFRKQMQGVWDKLSGEIPAGSLGYFRLQPLDLSLTNLHFENNILNLQMGIRCQPQFSLRSEPALPKPLPDMSDITGTEGFSLYLDASLPYKELSSMVMKKIGDTSFIIKGRKFHIDDIRLFSASDNKIGVKLKFSGNKKGIIYLTGTPLLDTVKNELSVPDISFDIKTKNLLIQAASWIMDGKIESSLRNQMKFSLTPMISSAQKEINQALNRKMDNGILLKGNISTLQLQSIYALSDKILLRILSKGVLATEMN